MERMPPEPPLPPKVADIEKGFATVHDWLSHIINTKKPRKKISEYGFGVFRLKGHYILHLHGQNMYPVESKKYGNYSESRSDFGPFYFQLPKAYEALSLQQARDKVLAELKAFVGSGAFRQSYFADADNISFFSSGKEVIWNRN
jgi:hypothetical protein